MEAEHKGDRFSDIKRNIRHRVQKILSNFKIDFLNTIKVGLSCIQNDRNTF